MESQSLLKILHAIVSRRFNNQFRHSRAGGSPVEPVTAHRMSLVSRLHGNDGMKRQASWPRCSTMMPLISKRSLCFTQT